MKLKSRNERTVFQHPRTLRTTSENSSKMSFKKQQRKWIALAEVTPVQRGDTLESSAFVNVLGLAQDRDSFVELIQHGCEQMKIQLNALEDIELWDTRTQKNNPSAEVRALANSLSLDEPLHFDSFYCFPEQETET